MTAYSATKGILYFFAYFSAKLPAEAWRVSFQQPSNAQSPMLVTLFGISTLCKFVQL